MATVKENKSIEELEKLEVDAKSDLLNVNAEIAALTRKRSELIQRISDGDESAISEVEKGDQYIKRLGIKAEAIEVTLKTFPSRKDYARGIAIDANIPIVQKMADGINPLVDDVNKKMKAAIEANRKLLTYLESFDELGTDEQFALNRNFVYTGLNALQSAGSFATPGVVGNPQNVDLEIPLLLMTYDKKILSGWVEHTKDSIAKRINVMSTHARQLKGE